MLKSVELADVPYTDTNYAAFVAGKDDLNGKCNMMITPGGPVWVELRGQR